MAKKRKTRSSKQSKAKNIQTQPAEGDEPTVDRMLIALQKTLSRVSRDSASVPEGQARALITGSVQFELEVKCSLIEGEKLLLDEERGRPLKLSGQIAADIGVELTEGVDNAS